MAENRIPREVDNRQLAERPKAWTPPELLPEPDKQPGFAYRWIRVSMLNVADPRNLSMRMREGWEPVTLTEQPKFKLLADPNSQYKDNVEIGGLLLCKAPEEFVKQRMEYEANMTQSQADAVDNSFMRQNDARMPLFSEKKSTVSFGKKD
jgi:hypothetical protein